ncbi:hypothetical protein AKJ16_DCAP04880 [Drosera capensis]
MTFGQPTSSSHNQSPIRINDSPGHRHRSRTIFLNNMRGLILNGNGLSACEVRLYTSSSPGGNNGFLQKKTRLWIEWLSEYI